MSRLLVIMRHAKSDWESGAMRDFDRPLSPRGERDAPRMARWLREQQLVPQQLISSPAVRARDTVRHVARELGIKAENIEWEPRIYQADVDDLLAVLADHDTSAPVRLLVGHNPGLESLARYLARSETLPKEEKLLPTAGVVVIELPENLHTAPRGGAACVGHMRPRWLKE